MKKSWLRFSLFTLLGAALGFSYYYFIGCHNGSCAIASDPVNSTAYGSLWGVLLGINMRGKKSSEDAPEPGNG